MLPTPFPTVPSIPHIYTMDSPTTHKARQTMLGKSKGRKLQFKKKGRKKTGGKKGGKIPLRVALSRPMIRRGVKRRSRRRK